MRKPFRKVRVRNHLRFFIYLPFLFFIFTFPSCQKRTTHQVSIAFYHWKSQAETDSTVLAYLTKLKVKKIYYRLFDVDWNEFDKKALPIGEIDSIPSTFVPYQLVPTIFITNRTILQIPSSKITDLAEKIVQKIRAKTKNRKISEIQLDCDWSEKSKQRYFQLISAIKKIVSSDNIKLSATIRLHQYRYFCETGVPDVAKGVLMFYNMGDIRAEDTQNSILDNRVGSAYLQTKQDYPIPLQIALPLFGWGVLKRQGKVIDLLNNAQNTDFRDGINYREIADNQYEVLKSHYAFGKYLYKNDKIRVEQITYSQLTQSIRLLQKHLNADSIELIFYHLDKEVLKNFSVTQLSKLAEELR